MVRPAAIAACGSQGAGWPHCQRGQNGDGIRRGVAKEKSLYGNAYTGRTFHGEFGFPMNEKVAEAIDPAIGWLRNSNELVTEYAGDIQRIHDHPIDCSYDIMLSIS